MTEIRMPKAAERILEALAKAGYEAFIVGGCVRDSLMGREPKDWDITTSARPDQVKRLFRRTIDTGIKHGTVTVLMDGEGFEVTTYRVDGSYADGRHPDQVTFTPLLEEDLKRRDFTINAMAYSPLGGLVDIFGGQEDLRSGVVRCVGDPQARFDEDALRILRALRFAAQLGFSIDPATQAAIGDHAGRLSLISAERIREELVKLLVSPHPGMIRLACDLGLTAVILPEYDRIRGLEQHSPHHIYDVEAHTLAALEASEPDQVLRLTMLLHDFGKADAERISVNGRERFQYHQEIGAAMADRILRRLKFDNATRERVVRLIGAHDLKYEATERGLRRALHRVGADIFDDFIRVQRADIMGKNPEIIPSRLEGLRVREALYRKVIAEGQCYSVKQLAVNGKDLIAAGIRPGPQMGSILERLTAAVIEDPSLNEARILTAMALRLDGNIS